MPTTRLALLATALFGLVLALLIACFAARPGIAAQPNPWTETVVLGVVLALYLGAIAVLRRAPWPFLTPAARTALTWGPIAGAVEIAAITVENLPIPPDLTAGVTLTFMGLAFVSWAVPAALTEGSLLPRVAASMLTAGIAMLCAVAAGFAVQVLLAPPADTVVATWAEFLRSGWTDPHAFVLANAVDSA